MSRREMEIAALELVAKQYEDDGYSVQIEPGNQALPDEIQGYSPDLVATKGEQKIAVEVKFLASKRIRREMENLARAFRAIPNWRFDLVVMEDFTVIPNAPNFMVYETKMQRIASADMVVRENRDFQGGILLLWTVIEGTLREAVYSTIQESGSMPNRLIKESYSLGIITEDEAAWLRQLLEARNAIVHGEFPGGATEAEYSTLRDNVIKIIDRTDVDEEETSDD